jgi:hypothetical protein
VTTMPDPVAESAGNGAESDGSVSDLVKEALEVSPQRSAVRASINPYAFTLGLGSIFLLTRVASYLTPFKLYFSFQSFLFATDDRLKWTSLGIKLAIPAVVAFCLFYLPFRWINLADDRGADRPVARYLAFQAELSAKAAAFFGALLMAWPFIVYWDLMVPPNLNEHRIAFYFIYLLYLISYAYFAAFGILVAKWFSGQSLNAFQKFEIEKTVGLIEGVRTSAMGVLTSAFATYLSTNLATAS